MQNKNLDARINGYSYKMVNKLDEEAVDIKEIDKALGILCNDGVYGYYVYCKSKAGSKDDENKDKNKDKAKIESTIFSQFVAGIVEEFCEIISNDYNIGSKKSFEEYDKYFSILSEDICKLLFFKDILERILIYARYHGKALGKLKGGKNV